MKITNSVRASILSGIRNKGINQSDLAAHLGFQKNWATRLFNGTLKTLSEENVDKICEYLGITLTKVTSSGEPVSPLALQLGKAMEENEHLAMALDHLARYTEDHHSSYTLPYIPTEDLIAFGQEMVRAAHEDPGKPGKVGRIGVVYIASILEKLSEAKRQETRRAAATTTASPPASGHHLLPCIGSLSAGSALYTEPFRWEDEPKQFVRVDRSYPDDHFAVQVCGDSMEPGIPDSSLIVMKRVHPGEETEGKIYAVCEGGGMVLKRLISKSGQWYLHSTNPKYPEYQPLDDSIIQALFVDIC
ncbi:LexA repressor [Rubritalea halochordaticola]|uniref:LexA repressor n=1 Tax=Rubritalea halochordaticola TaxID=714537 RepID=A0ABP9V4L3_9BACT